MTKENNEQAQNFYYIPGSAKRLVTEEELNEFGGCNAVMIKPSKKIEFPEKLGPKIVGCEEDAARHQRMFNEIYQTMGEGLLGAMKCKKTSYCFHYPFGLDDLGLSLQAAIQLKHEAAEKNWFLDFEDMSGLDGTIVFSIG